MPSASVQACIEPGHDWVCDPQVDSLEEADKKIDELAATGKLDPALLLMMAKAYAGSKETDITQEEVGTILGVPPHIRCCYLFAAG